MDSKSALPANPDREPLVPDGAQPSAFESVFAQPLQQEKPAPCQANCPSSADIRGWISRIAQHQKLGITREQAYEDAWNMIVEVNPLLASVGRVCPHPCQDLCNREDKDGAVSVNAMERFIGDWGLKRGLALRCLEATRHVETIGVIGAGPAGLSFAYQLARRGYSVTIYEQYEQAGGMLRYGIPEYRLPAAILDAEIQRIVNLGVEIKTGISIGRDLTLDDLRANHDVLFLGIGAQHAVRLGIPGEEGPGVWTGTDYLHRINTAQSVDVGTRVIVVGGGNTAIDAARAARRQGADVTLLYRRTRTEMPALEEEVNDAIQEEVQIEYLVAPVEIKRNGNSVASIVVQRMRLGEPDDSGRPRPVPVEGSEFEIETDCVIAAVSQRPELAGLEGVPVEGGYPASDAKGQVDNDLWAGGDVLGLGIATLALAQGREAAEMVHRQLRGLAPQVASEEKPITSALLNTDYYSSREPGELPRRPVENWLREPDQEIDETISEEQFLEEVSRCLSCGLCFGCEHCWMYCNASAFTRLDEVEPGRYFTLSLVDCEGCGKCLEVCPSGFLSLRDWTE